MSTKVYPKTICETVYKAFPVPLEILSVIMEYVEFNHKQEHKEKNISLFFVFEFPKYFMLSLDYMHVMNIEDYLSLKYGNEDFPFPMRNEMKMYHITKKMWKNIEIY